MTSFGDDFGTSACELSAGIVRTKKEQKNKNSVLTKLKLL